jgi:hypothetical protein
MACSRQSITYFKVNGKNELILLKFGFRLDGKDVRYYENYEIPLHTNIVGVGFISDDQTVEISPNKKYCTEAIQWGEHSGVKFELCKTKDLSNFNYKETVLPVYNGRLKLEKQLSFAKVTNKRVQLHAYTGVVIRNGILNNYITLLADTDVIIVSKLKLNDTVVDLSSEFYNMGIKLPKPTLIHLRTGDKSTMTYYIPNLDSETVELQILTEINSVELIHIQIEKLPVRNIIEADF